MGYYPNDPLRAAQQQIAAQREEKEYHRKCARLAQRAAAGDLEAKRELRRIRKKRSKARKRLAYSIFAKPKRDPLAPIRVPTPFVSGGAIESNRRRH